MSLVVISFVPLKIIDDYQIYGRFRYADIFTNLGKEKTVVKECTDQQKHQLHKNGFLTYKDALILEKKLDRLGNLIAGLALLLLFLSRQ